jgi:transcriptional regulator with XRE-family HTH domain
MKKQPKRSKFIARETREILAENVKRRLAQQFNHGTNRVESLAKRIGTSKSTVQRVLAADVGITVDVLTQVAMGLRCSPYELLMPPDEE